MAIIERSTNAIPSDGFSYPFLKAGALVANDFAGQCSVGSLAINTTGGVLFICTATNGSTTSTWTVVGAQV